MTITARLADGRIAVRSPYECRDIARNIAGGRWKSEAKAWTYPPTPTAALAVYRAYTSKDYTLHASTEVLTLIVAALDAEAARAAKTAEDLPDLDVRHCECDEPERVEDVPFCLRCKLIFESWLHQRRAFHFAKAQHGAALIVGMGGGKSLAATALFEEWDAKRVLIVCPRNVVGVWPKELRKHGHEWEVWHGQVLGRSGRPKKNPSIAERGKAARAFLHGLGPDQRGAVVVNYEAYWRGALAAMIEDFEWDAIALDESHRIKAPGGKASQFAGRLSDAAPRKLILTGTLMPHSPLDVYAQFRFLDPAVFGTNFARFRSRYAIMGGYEGREVVGWQREDELARKWGEHAFVITQEELDEAIDLPACIDVERTCTLSPKTREVYDDLWRQLVVTLGEKSCPNCDGTGTLIDEGIEFPCPRCAGLGRLGGASVVAENVLTRLLRVQQVTSGHLPVGEGDEREVVEIGTEKRDLLADTLEDVPEGERVVVFCRFTHDLDNVRHVAEAQGRRYGELSGRDHSGLSPEATFAEGVEVLGVQIQAGGVGIDLSAASIGIFYSVGFSLGDFEQARKRVHRPGQRRTTTLVHLLAEETVDEFVYQTLRARKKLVGAITEYAQRAG